MTTLIDFVENNIEKFTISGNRFTVKPGLEAEVSKEIELLFLGKGDLTPCRDSALKELEYDQAYTVKEKMFFIDDSYANSIRIQKSDDNTNKDIFLTTEKFINAFHCAGIPN